MQETQVISLGQEDPLKEGMTTHSSILAWETPWTEEPGAWVHKRIRHDLVTEKKKKTTTTQYCIFEDLFSGSTEYKQ